MKIKRTLLIALLAISANAQYNKSSLELEVGYTKVQDVTGITLVNIEMGYRYMANTMFGGKANIGYTDIRSHQITEASLHGVLNVGRLLKFETFTRNYTILGGLGCTYTHTGWESNDDVFHQTDNYHLSGFITNEFKMTDRVFMSASLGVITGVNSRPYNGISTETTNIIDFNFGVAIALGKQKHHADWYLDEIKPRVDTILMQPTYIDRTKTEIRYTEPEPNTQTEMVLFAHDSDVISEGLENIEKAVNAAKGKITLIGYCSNTGSPEYNKDLALRRAKAVAKKIYGLGYGGEVEIISEGIRPELGKDVHDLARGVMIMVD